MRFLGAFLAEGHGIRSQLYDIQGAGLGSIDIEVPGALPPDATFDISFFVVCEAGGDDAGSDVAINLEVLGPNGNQLVHKVIESMVPGPSAFVAMRVPTPLVGAGHYVYRAWIAGAAEADSVGAPLDVRINVTNP